MARSQGVILASIWNDPDWKALGRDEQWMFELLISQANMTHCGVIALTDRRWARMAAGTTAADIMKFLGNLAAADFVLLDEETDEVLVRTFLRNDGVITQGNVFKSALRSAQAVQSPALRAAILRELVRDDVRSAAWNVRVQGNHDPVWPVYVETMLALGGTQPDIPSGPDGGGGGVRDAAPAAPTDAAPAAAEVVSTLPNVHPIRPDEPPAKGSETLPEGFANPTRTLREPPSRHPGEGEGVGEVVTTRTPVTEISGCAAYAHTREGAHTHAREGAPPKRRRGGGRAGDGTRAVDLPSAPGGAWAIVTPWRHTHERPYRTATYRDIAAEVGKLLAQNADHELIRAALDAWDRRAGARPKLLPFLYDDAVHGTRPGASITPAPGSGRGSRGGNAARSVEVAAAEYRRRVAAGDPFGFLGGES